MVAGDEGDEVGRAEPFEEGARDGEFRGEADVGDIAGEGDVVGLVGPHVLDQPFQHRHVVGDLAAAAPVDVARHALADELAQLGLWNGADMRIGKVGDEIHWLSGGSPRHRRSEPARQAAGDTNWRYRCAVSAAHRE
jgi:hypothetical protein